MTFSNNLDQVITFPINHTITPYDNAKTEKFFVKKKAFPAVVTDFQEMAIMQNFVSFAPDPVP